MYCANCGMQLVQGLSYCNRCGFSLRERTESTTAARIAPISAFLLAIIILGLAGLGTMVGGAIALRSEVGLSQDLIAVFMLFTFLLVSGTEFMLFRNLSKLLSAKESSQRSLPPPAHQDLRLPQASHLGEPVPSVTENTTRTLEYARREQQNN